MNVFPLKKRRGRPPKFLSVWQKQFLSDASTSQSGQTERNAQPQTVSMSPEEDMRPDISHPKDSDSRPIVLNTREWTARHNPADQGAEWSANDHSRRTTPSCPPPPTEGSHTSDENHASGVTENAANERKEQNQQKHQQQQDQDKQTCQQQQQQQQRQQQYCQNHQQQQQQQQQQDDQQQQQPTSNNFTSNRFVGNPDEHVLQNITSSHKVEPLTPPPLPVKRRVGRPPGSSKKSKMAAAVMDEKTFDLNKSPDASFSLRRFFEAGGRDYNEYLTCLNRLRPPHPSHTHTTHHPPHHPAPLQQNYPVALPNTLIMSPPGGCQGRFSTRPSFPGAPAPRSPVVAMTAPQGHHGNMPLMQTATEQTSMHYGIRHSQPFSSNNLSYHQTPPSKQDLRNRGYNLTQRVPRDFCHNVSVNDARHNGTNTDQKQISPGITYTSEHNVFAGDAELASRHNVSQNDSSSKVLDLSLSTNSLSSNVSQNTSREYRTTPSDQITHKKFRYHGRDGHNVPANSPTERQSVETERKRPSVGKSLESWSVEEVSQFVSDLPECKVYCEIFRTQRIDGATLPHLSDDHLLNHVGMKLGHMIRLKLAVKRLSSSEGTDK